MDMYVINPFLKLNTRQSTVRTRYILQSRFLKGMFEIFCVVFLFVGVGAGAKEYLAFNSNPVSCTEFQLMQDRPRVA